MLSCSEMQLIFWCVQETLVWRGCCCYYNYCIWFCFSRKLANVFWPRVKAQIMHDVWGPGRTPLFSLRLGTLVSVWRSRGQGWLPTRLPGVSCVFLHSSKALFSGKTHLCQSEERQTDLWLMTDWWTVATVIFSVMEASTDSHQRYKCGYRNGLKSSIKCDIPKL